MAKWKVSGSKTISWHGEVEADTEDEAIQAASDAAQLPYIGEEWDDDGEFELHEDGVKQIESEDDE